MKLRTTALCGLLIVALSLVGCGTDKGASESSQSTTDAESGASPHTEESESLPGGDTSSSTSFVKTSDDLTITVEMDKELYDLNTLIRAGVTITNAGDNTLVYIQGSGSNYVPDAMEISLGGFSGLFYPEAVTMDYRTEMLEPGKSLQYDCTFAPYIPKDDTKAFGTDKDLAFFQSDDFTPATPGSVDGNVAFTFYVQPADADPQNILLVDGLEAVTVAVPFVATIQ